MIKNKLSKQKVTLFIIIHLILNIVHMPRSCRSKLYT